MGFIETLPKNRSWWVKVDRKPGRPLNLSPRNPTSRPQRDGVAPIGAGLNEGLRDVAKQVINSGKWSPGVNYQKNNLLVPYKYILLISYLQQSPMGCHKNDLPISYLLCPMSL